MIMASLDLLMCHTCATQFDAPADQPLSGCRICDDPRQYVPPTGQRWTSLRQELNLHGSATHKNHIIPLTINLNSNSELAEPVPKTSEAQAKAASPSLVDPSTTKTMSGIYTMYTSPKFGIGERVILIPTPNGTIMWDLLAYLDEDTIKALKAPPFNGLKAIVISHPHYYTNHLDWAETFDCPVYIASEDEVWVNRKDVNNRRRLITSATQEIVPGVTAIKVGGHFPGSLVLHSGKQLFVADSLVTQPSGLYHVNRPSDTISYTFMWSIPNMIPLPPGELLHMWKAIEPFGFESTHGAFVGQDICDANVKKRILQSMKIQVKNATGNEEHEIMKC